MKVNHGWNPQQWLHDLADKQKDPMKQASYHNIATHWPNWHDDDAVMLNDEENGISHGFKSGWKGKKAKKTVDQLLNYRRKRTK